MRSATCLTMVVVLVSLVGPGSRSLAIEIHPTKTQVRSAMEQGKQAASENRSPEVFYVRFGSTGGTQPNGYLVTKLGGVAVMTAHMARHGLDPTESDIAHLLDNPTMLISTTIFGDHPSFAEQSYMVLDQGRRVIKPITVRADGQADRSPAWPESPRFQARVVALFSYADFDPKAASTILLYPAGGGELRFSMDFGKIE